MEIAYAEIRRRVERGPAYASATAAALGEPPRRTKAGGAGATSTEARRSTASTASAEDNDGDSNAAGGAPLPVVSELDDGAPPTDSREVIARAMAILRGREEPRETPSPAAARRLEGRHVARRLMQSRSTGGSPVFSTAARSSGELAVSLRRTTAGAVAAGGDPGAGAALPAAGAHPEMMPLEVTGPGRGPAAGAPLPAVFGGRASPAAAAARGKRRSLTDARHPAPPERWGGGRGTLAATRATLDAGAEPFSPGAGIWGEASPDAASEATHGRAGAAAVWAYRQRPAYVSRMRKPVTQSEVDSECRRRPRAATRLPGLMVLRVTNLK